MKKTRMRSDLRTLSWRFRAEPLGAILQALSKDRGELGETLASVCGHQHDPDFAELLTTVASEVDAFSKRAKQRDNAGVIAEWIATLAAWNGKSPTARVQAERFAIAMFDHLKVLRSDYAPGEYRVTPLIVAAVAERLRYQHRLLETDGAKIVRSALRALGLSASQSESLLDFRRKKASRRARTRK